MNTATILTLSGLMAVCASSALAQNVLVVRDFLPNGGDAVQEFVDLGATVSEIPTSLLLDTALSPYCVVYVTGIDSQSGDAVETTLNAAAGHLESYVQGGGLLFYETGSNGAQYTLPGGVTTFDFMDWENFVLPGHPATQGLPGFLPANCSSFSTHALDNLPPGTQTLSTGSYGGAPAVTVSYSIGAGEVLATGIRAEYGMTGSSCWFGPDGPVQLWRALAEYALGTCGQSTSDTEDLPSLFALDNYPNPFNPTTSIRFRIPETGAVELGVYNLRGELVRQLHSGLLSAGAHTMPFDASGLSSGTYLYSLETGEERITKRMLLVK